MQQPPLHGAVDLGRKHIEIPGVVLFAGVLDGKPVFVNAQQLLAAIRQAVREEVHRSGEPPPAGETPPEPGWEE